MTVTRFCATISIVKNRGRTLMILSTYPLAVAHLLDDMYAHDTVHWMQGYIGLTVVDGVYRIDDTHECTALGAYLDGKESSREGYIAIAAKLLNVSEQWMHGVDDGFDGFNGWTGRDITEEYTDGYMVGKYLWGVSQR